MEKLERDSLKRYDNITSTLIDLGYKMKEGFPRNNSEGKLEWIFIDSEGEEYPMNETNILQHPLVSSKERWKRIDESLDMILTPEFLKEFLITSRKTQ